MKQLVILSGKGGTGKTTSAVTIWENLCLQPDRSMRAVVGGSRGGRGARVGSEYSQGCQWMYSWP